MTTADAPATPEGLAEITAAIHGAPWAPARCGTLNCNCREAVDAVLPIVASLITAARREEREAVVTWLERQEVITDWQKRRPDEVAKWFSRRVAAAEHLSQPESGERSNGE